MSDRSGTSRTEQLEVLLETVERIRQQKYPEIPSGLVRQVLLGHSDAAATDTDLVREFEKLAGEALRQENKDA